MHKIILIAIFLVSIALNAACLGHSPGEVYFEAYTKDANGYYTVDALYRTRDYGQTAQVVIENFNGFIYRDAKPGSFYKYVPNGSLYYSPDTCKTWRLIHPNTGGVMTSPFAGIIVADGNKLSKDFGTTWTTMQCNGLSGSYPSSWGLLQGEMYSQKYVTDSLKKLYRSTDYGNNFTFVSDITIPYALGPGYGWLPGELILATSISDPQGKRYFRSIDYGLTFEYIYTLPNYLNSYQSLKGFVRNEYSRYAINRYNYPYCNKMDIKFMHSTNFGQTWDSVLTNYTNSIEENGDWKIDNGELANYPNPFNNSTMVNYQLKKSDMINLAIYNTKGELVRKLFNGQQIAGNHQAFFDASGLNSGVYYIRLQGKKVTNTIKCILLK